MPIARTARRLAIRSGPAPTEGGGEVGTGGHHLRRGRKNDPRLHITELDLISPDASPEQLAAQGQLMDVEFALDGDRLFNGIDSDKVNGQFTNLWQPLHDLLTT